MQHKKVFKILIRILPLVVVFAVFFGSIIPVSAREVFDYIDYSKTYEYANGTKKIVTTFDYAVDDITPTWGFFDKNNNWSYITDIDGVEAEWTFYKNKPIQVKLYAAGVNNVWNISTIPNGISFDVVADVNFFSTGGVIEGPFNFSTTRYGFHVQYYDKDLEYISMQSIVAGTGEVASFQAFAQMNIPDNARYARFDCVWFECLYEGPNASIDVSMSVNKFVLSLFVPASTASDDMLNEQEKTNDLLDDILNGSQEDNKDADDLEDKTDDSLGDLEDAGDALENVERPEINADDLVPDDLFGDDYLLLVDTIKIFWKSDIITKNLTIMAGFILLALVIHGKK